MNDAAEAHDTPGIAVSGYTIVNERATTMTSNPYPVTVTVTDRGVTVEHSRGSNSMSRFSERAQRLTAGLGIGVHVVASDADAARLPASVLEDLNGALA